MLPAARYSPNNNILYIYNFFFRLDSFILPRGIPIEELKRKFVGEREEYSIAALIHAVSNCVWCFWMRDVDAQSVKVSLCSVHPSISLS